MATVHSLVLQEISELMNLVFKPETRLDWFFHRALTGLDLRTPAEAVADGDATQVLDLLRKLQHYSPD